MKKNTHSNFTVIILKDVFLTILFVCFSFFNLAHTQPLTNDTISKSLISRFSIESWTTEQGLPTNELVEIYQTTDGYLWISSHEGLIRFDGFKFEIYNTENTGIFPNNSFHSFSEDKDSTLWISSINGYFTYKNGNFAKSSPELENIANLKKETRDWLLMKNKETFFLDENTLHFPKLDTSIANIQLNAIIKDQSNNFYFGTSKGLFQLSDKEIKCFNKNTGLANDFITNFLMDDENVLWVSTISGLYYFDGFTFREDSSFKNIVIKNIVVDNNGDYWFTSTTGLYRKSIANNKVENISLVNKIGINDFSGIFIDSENNIWAQPLRGGLIRLKREKTTVFDMESDMQAKVVNAVHEYKPNEFLIAFEDGIIQIIKNGYTQNFKLNNSLKGNRVRHIFSDSDGNIWISTYKGLLKIDLLGREKWFNPQNGFPSNLIRFVYEDKQNNIWVGTSDAGLIKINTPQANKVVDQTTGLSSNFIMSIEEDKTGNLIVGTSGGGINRIRNDEVIEVIATKTGLISDIVFNTYIDTANIIWVVTNSGLSRISSDTIVNYNVNIGLSSNSPFSIKEDNKGSLWLPFPLGIM
ncbi:MAG: hypothetical protein HQ521_16560, partial [Bacteroidetes bacterium]|nr:hypothetical protein [Bacteroidota bacterium]